MGEAQGKKSHGVVGLCVWGGVGGGGWHRTMCMMSMAYSIQEHTPTQANTQRQHIPLSVVLLGVMLLLTSMPVIAIATLRNASSKGNTHKNTANPNP